jgi:hypothetical protein
VSGTVNKRTCITTGNLGESTQRAASDVLVKYVTDLQQDTIDAQVLNKMNTFFTCFIELIKKV